MLRSVAREKVEEGVIESWKEGGECVEDVPHCYPFWIVWDSVLGIDTVDRWTSEISGSGLHKDKI